MNLITNLKEFVCNEKFRYLILIAGLSITLMYDGYYFNENINRFKKEFTFAYCMNMYRSDIDNETGQIILIDRTKINIKLLNDSFINNDSFKNLSVGVK